MGEGSKGDTESTLPISVDSSEQGGWGGAEKKKHTFGDKGQKEDVLHAYICHYIVCWEQNGIYVGDSHGINVGYLPTFALPKANITPKNDGFQ